MLLENHHAIHPMQRMVLICDVLTLADAGLIPEEVKWRILAYGINEEEFGPNMAFFLCSRASLRSSYAEKDKEVVESWIQSTPAFNIPISQD